MKKGRRKKSKRSTKKTKKMKEAEQLIETREKLKEQYDKLRNELYIKGTKGNKYLHYGKSYAKKLLKLSALSLALYGIYKYIKDPIANAFNNRLNDRFNIIRLRNYENLPAIEQNLPVLEEKKETALSRRRDESIKRGLLHYITDREGIPQDIYYKIVNYLYYPQETLEPHDEKLNMKLIADPISEDATMYNTKRERIKGLLNARGFHADYIYRQFSDRQIDKFEDLAYDIIKGYDILYEELGNERHIAGHWLSYALSDILRLNQQIITDSVNQIYNDYQKLKAGEIVNMKSLNEYFGREHFAREHFGRELI